MIQAVLFDFDYTLADSSDAVVECFNTGLAGIGLPHAEPDAIRRTIGLSIPDSLAQVAGPEHLHRAEEFRLHWRRRSDEIMVEWTRVFEWTPPATGELLRAGYRLGIVSTKYRGRIESTLDRHGLRERFEAIVGGEDVERHKPHPEGIQRAAAALGIDPREALYVGDTAADAAAAREAGAPFVGVLSGMTGEEELRAYPHRAILPSIGELPALLRSAGAAVIDD
jgi:phosphoglycolate phosphatase